MPADKLTPQFDIVPHGITKLDQTMYMSFKMIVTFEEFKTGGKITFDMWQNAAKEIDGMVWGYQINSATIDFKMYAEGDGPVLFNFDSKNPKSFGFGQRSPGKSVFQFLSSNFELAVPEKAADKVQQMEAGVSQNKFAPSRIGNYSEILDSARRFDEARKKDFSTVKSGKKDFTAVYAAVLDDTPIAEKGFGLVRTFHVPIHKTAAQANAESLVNNIYKIRILNAMSDASYVLEKKDIKGVAKYYNGLSSKYFTGSDFLSVQLLNCDPYKSNLASDPENKDQIRPYPDGAYMFVVYQEDPATKVIKDPFEADGVKGFNAIVKQNETYFSLSQHQTVVTLKDTSEKPFSYVGSGSLTPRSSLLTNNGNKRNNLLFAWRGDHLLVNREVTPKKGETEGKAVRYDEFKDEEDKFIKKDLFEKKQKLIPGSQTQLHADKNYEFFARRVSVTGYYIPLQREIGTMPADVQVYTLTMEDDLLNVPIVNVRLGDKFEIKSAELPIKSAAVIGTKIYKQQDMEFVDQAQQIVLDLRTESKEQRYVYPPQIKLEDLKLLAYLSREKLTKKGEVDPGSMKLAMRCLELEERIPKKIRKKASNTEWVPYLTDPRGKNIFLCGADFLSATKLPGQLKAAFQIDNQFPFYNKTSSVELSLEKKGNESVLKMSSKVVAGQDIWTGIKKGIYNLSLYIADQAVTEQNISRYAEIPFKISVLGLPEKPLVVNQSAGNPEKKVTRNIQFPNYWFEELNNSGATDGWKSLKYLERNQILKLQHGAGLDQLLEDYYQQTKVKRLELFNDEYPYELFLGYEGGFEEENGLKTSIYPNHVRLSCDATDIEPGKFFSWKLNDEETLVATVVKADTLKSIIFSVGDSKMTSGSTGSIVISFDPDVNQYVIKGGAPATAIPLKNYLYQELSVKDIQVSDKVFEKIRLKLPQKNSGIIKVDDIKSFIFIADNRSPYHQKKEVKFYASSMFQAYYPKLTSEFTLGTMADKIVNLQIPNNTKPDPPIIKYEKLIKSTTNESWSGMAKESHTESLVCLILQPDFMKEGQNKLGIVLEASPVNAVRNLNVSMVGEDITKLTVNNNLSALKVEDVINNQKSSKLLTKYISAEPIKYYEIEKVVYKVLECIPFYNTKTRQWQVVLSFDLKLSETMFMKLVTLKISNGHGLKTANGNQAGPANGLKDTTGSNLSIFSAPCEFPVYNKKRIVVKKTANALGQLFNISIESVSDYKDNVFFVMLLKRNSTGDLLNLIGNFEVDKFPSLASFGFYTPTPASMSEKGKILQFHGVNEIAISREVCEFVVVLEFEVHQNHDLDLTKPIDFVSVNPLFENKGIRLVNAAEFKY